MGPGVSAAPEPLPVGLPAARRPCWCLPRRRVGSVISGGNVDRPRLSAGLAR